MNQNKQNKNAMVWHSRNRPKDIQYISVREPGQLNDQIVSDLNKQGEKQIGRYQD